MNIIKTAEAHPVAAGAVVFAGGLGILWILGFFNSGGSSDQGAGQSAYFAAQAASAQSGDQLAAVQIAANASTATALINANANENIQATWANAGVANTQSANQTAEVTTNLNDAAQTSIARINQIPSILAALSSILSSNSTYYQGHGATPTISLPDFGSIALEMPWSGQSTSSLVNEGFSDQQIANVTGTTFNGFVPGH